MAPNAGVGASLSLAVKVIKEHKFDSSAAKLKFEEEMDLKKKQSEARKFAVQVLMDHGVTHSVAYKTARRASKI